MANDQNSWYTSFHAFECIINRIDQACSYYHSEKIAELKRIGRILPGSLSELKTHLESLLNVYSQDRSKFLKSPIYLWFLIEKANYTFSYFNEKISLESELIKPVRNLKFEGLITQDQLNLIGEQNLIKWKNYISGKLKNAKNEINT